ncbi:peroxidase [candidate division GN15 bacterium]|nr:peroxidase [candidate division GN15 bacterium]
MRSTKNDDGSPIPEELKNQLLKNYETADISTLDKLILDFAEKITKNAAGIKRAYVDTLRAQGFDDHLIHDIVQVTAYFNYVNRLADALGVELDT